MAEESRPLTTFITLFGRYQFNKLDDTLAFLSGAVRFSKLDANKGFWQVPLAEESRPLTTFITTFGRYQFNKLPFGTPCAPELFQSRMNAVLDGLEGFICLIDDVLVFGKSQDEHDTRLKAVLQRLEEAKVTLNGSKCEFNKSCVKFLGHIIDQNGTRADSAKTTSITKMPPPQPARKVFQSNRGDQPTSERAAPKRQCLGLGPRSTKSI